MTFAGFFVHLEDIPPVLRWLQWFCPLKYCLEALSVNEVDSGLMITDTLQGVPVDVSASLIMQLVRLLKSRNDAFAYRLLPRAVVRIRPKQLLPRCPRPVRIHRRVRARCDCDRVVQG